jgi:hypothetical protein
MPEAEGTLYVDRYSSTFVRVRDVDNILSDGGPHLINFALATVAGPGGEVFPTANDMPPGSTPVWFDNGGTLGYVKAPTGSNVTQTTLRDWVKYGAAHTGTSQTILRAHTDLTDPAHPALVISDVINLS